MSAECVVPECSKTARPGRRHGLCSMHASRMERHGSLADPSPTYSERLMANVQKTEGCWLWTAPLTSKGYGQARNDRGQMKPAHRAVYELLLGPVSPGLHLDHLCRNRACVNPTHLEPVTPAENIRRGEPASRTHCPRNHEYTPENTRIRGGSRHCLACHRINQANYLARKKVA